MDNMKFNKKSLQIIASTCLILSACEGNSEQTNESMNESSNFVINLNSSTNGAISTIEPDDKGSLRYIVKPNEHYIIETVSGCDGSLSSDIYTVDTINENCTIDATFSLENYSIETIAGINGTISPINPTVEYGQNMAFTVTPDPGYGVGAISGCDISQYTYRKNNTATVEQATKNCILTVDFIKIKHALVNDKGEQISGQSSSASISADGRFVAFLYSGINLLSGNSDRVSESVFIHDTLAGIYTQVSRGSSSQPSISADGRFVAYVDHNNIYLYDTETETTTLISKNNTGTSPSDGWSSSPSISADGRFVIFESNLNTLVNDDSNDSRDVFMRDTKTKITSRVSEDVGDNTFNMRAAISADGRFVAFESEKTNSVDPFAAVETVIYIRDNEEGITINLGTGYSPKISGDGRFVSFVRSKNVYVFDVNNTSTKQITLDGGFNPIISSNGRYIAFSSTTYFSLPEIGNTFSLNIHDIETGETLTLAENVFSKPDNNSSSKELYLEDLYSINEDGRYIVLESKFDILLGGSTQLSELYMIECCE